MWWSEEGEVVQEGSIVGVDAIRYGSLVEDEEQESVDDIICRGPTIRKGGGLRGVDLQGVGDGDRSEYCDVVVVGAELLEALYDGSGEVRGVFLGFSNVEEVLLTGRNEGRRNRGVPHALDSLVRADF